MSHRSAAENEIASAAAGLDYHHGLEDWLGRGWVRFLLDKLTAERPGTAEPHLLRALMSYANPEAPTHERFAYWPIHKVIDLLRGSMAPEELGAKLGGHPPTVRGIMATARSVARFGLTTPQRWINPLFVVWNFTNRCNLHCQHCYQSSGSSTVDGELTLSQKLKVIDELGREYVAMLAFAGGEPTLSRHLEPCLARCQKYSMHTTLATHGGLMTLERCRRLADLGLRYVEVSLDSVDADKHDSFRGRRGAWREAVAGIKNVVATDGMLAGIAMCVHRDNLHEVEAMLEFAVKLGVSCFGHFNFIPVGRGREMVHRDITPGERDELLDLLHGWMESKRIGVISTAPQFGRVCLSKAAAEGMVSCSHAGNAAGTKARVVARYLGGCGAGRTYACLQPNGDLTPCVYMPDRIMGNVTRKSVSEVFQQSRWLDMFCDRDAREGACGSCDYRHYCGGCRARADAYFGQLDGADPGCSNNLEDWQKLVDESDVNDGQDFVEGPMAGDGEDERTESYI